MPLFDTKGNKQKINKPNERATDIRFITKNQFKDDEEQVAMLIQRRRLQLLIHSCIYYELDTSIIDDRQWDLWARELVELQKNNMVIASMICYHDAFKDWDASTGVFLPLKDDWVMRKAKQILISKEGSINNDVHKETIISNRKIDSQPKKVKSKK